MRIYLTVVITVLLPLSSSAQISDEEAIGLEIRNSLFMDCFREIERILLEGSPLASQYGLTVGDGSIPRMLAEQNEQYMMEKTLEVLPEVVSISDPIERIQYFIGAKYRCVRDLLGLTDIVSSILDGN